MRFTGFIVGALAVMVAAGACRIPDSRSSTTPEPAPELVLPVPQPAPGLVVEAYTYNVFPGAYTIVCVPPEDLALPENSRRRSEFFTDADTAMNSQQPDPCPGGEPTGRFGGAG